MAKELWCRRCESELGWEDLRGGSPGNAESIYCSCGAFAGPGTDEVIPIEHMTIEDQAVMAAAKEDLEPEVDAAGVPIIPGGGIVFTPAGVVITVGEAVSEHLTEAGKVIRDAVAKQFGDAAAARRYNGPMPEEVVVAWRNNGVAFMRDGSVEAAPGSRLNQPETTAARFDAAMDTASRLSLPKAAEPEAKPHMRVPSPAEKDAELARDRASIATQWDALRPKG